MRAVVLALLTAGLVAAQAPIGPFTFAPSGPAGGKLSGTYPNPGLNLVASDVTGLFGSCSGIMYLGYDGNCHAAGTGTGTVTSVAFPTIPSWLTAVVSAPTVAASIAVTATAGQTPHQVIGTCGAGTTFGPCLLALGDLPSGLGLTASPLSQFAATTSAQLRATLTDPTGTGPGVFANTPQLVTPNIDAATGKSVALTPAAATINRAVDVTQSGPTSGNQNAIVNFNSISITADQTNTGVTANIASALYINYVFGGSNAKGSRDGLFAQVVLNAPTSASNFNRNYPGVVAVCTAQTGDGGTNTGAGALGACFGLNGVAQSSGPNMYGVVGAEFDVSIVSPGTANHRWGVNSVASGDTAAAVSDAAYVVGATGTAPKWKTGLYFTDENGGAPISTAGCAICTDGSSHTIATGMDLSSYTITGNFLRGPNAFSVTGTGSVSAPRYLTSGSGPSCSSTGLGTGSCVAQGTDAAGSIVLSPTGSPAGAGGATLTFNAAMGVTEADCTFTYRNGSGAWGGTAVPLIIGTDSTTSIVVNWNNTAALTAGVSYLINYTCIAR